MQTTLQFRRCSPHRKHGRRYSKSENGRPEHRLFRRIVTARTAVLLHGYRPRVTTACDENITAAAQQQYLYCCNDVIQGARYRVPLQSVTRTHSSTTERGRLQLYQIQRTITSVIRTHSSQYNRARTAATIPDTEYHYISHSAQTAASATEVRRLLQLYQL